MKVLQVYKDYYPPVKGGVERIINLLANGLKEKGIDVEVLVSNDIPRLEKDHPNGISVTKAPQLGRFASCPLNVTFPFWLRRLARHADILHFHFPNPTAEISYLISGLQGKVVVSYHSDIVRQAKLGRLYAPILCKFLKRAQVIISSSPNYIRTSKILSQFRKKCKVIPLGIDLKRFKPLTGINRGILSLPNLYGRAIILFVGRFRYYKGLHILIKAMRNVNGNLLLIGAGPIEDRLWRQVTEEGLSKKIFFLGELSDEEVVTYLNLCDVFVFPSTLRSEAFGISMLEAMACEKPVVCTELGTGTSFVNQHQKTGLVVCPNDVAALARSINYLLSKPETRKRYGKAARKRVEEYFSKDTMISNIIGLYLSIL